MPIFLPEWLRQWTGGRWTRIPGLPMGGFSIDSRSLQEGQLFVAVRTAQRDGHDFLASARDAGASAALVDHPLDDPLPQLVVPDTVAAFQAIAREHRSRFHGPVIGITGSCGKTSTKEILWTLLGRDRVLKTQGNLNNLLGVPLTLTQLDPQTHTSAVIEAGINQPGEMERLADMIRPDLGIVTMVGPAHIEKLASLDGVAREKARLLEGAGPDATLLFPSSCLAYAPFRALDRRATVLFGSEDDDSLLPRLQTEPVNTQGGCRFLLRRPHKGTLEVELPPLSEGMIANAALALLAAGQLGVSDSMLASRIAAWRPATFRGEALQIGDSFYYVDCYNANPASMMDTLRSFAARFAHLPRVFVLGCMNELGEKSSAYHARVGASLRLGPEDHACLVGPCAGDYEEGLLSSGAQLAQVHRFHEAAQAKPFLESLHGPRAILLKGSRSYRLELLLPDDWEVKKGKEVAAC